MHACTQTLTCAEPCLYSLVIDFGKCEARASMVFLQLLIKTCIDPDGWGGLQQGPQSEVDTHYMLVDLCLLVYASVWGAFWVLLAVPTCVLSEQVVKEASEELMLLNWDSNQTFHTQNGELGDKWFLNRFPSVWSDIFSRIRCYVKTPKCTTHTTQPPASTHTTGKKADQIEDGVRELQAYSFMSFHPTFSSRGGPGSHRLSPQARTLLLPANFLMVALFKNPTNAFRRSHLFLTLMRSLYLLNLSFRFLTRLRAIKETALI